MKLAATILAVLIAACVAAVGAGAVGSPAADEVARSASAAAAVSLPQNLPRRDATHPQAFGYVSSEALARALAEEAGPPQPHSGTGTAVTVTATVLPVRTLVVRDGKLVEIWSNTDDPSPRASLYVVREGSSSGPTGELTSGIWSQARDALASADKVSGRIY